MQPTSLRALALLAATVSVAAQSSTVVSPISTATVEGDANNAFPWNSTTVRRYTQIHSDLQGVARNISQLSFRQNAGNTTNYTGTRAVDLEMFMADSVDWNRATFVFAQNYAGTPTNVLARRIVNIGPLGQNSTTGPLPFTVFVPLDAPWPYAGTRSFLWEALVYANPVSGTFNQIDAESGSSASGTSTITGSGCMATGRTTAMTHTLTTVDRAGTLVIFPTVSNGPSSAPSLLTLGLSNPNLPYPGLCTNLHTDLVALIDLGPTSATGSFSGDTGFGFVMPNVGLAGAVITSQVVSVDTGQTGLPLALSNGRSTVLPSPNTTDVVRVTRIYNNSTGTASLLAAPITSAHSYGVVVEFTY